MLIEKFFSEIGLSVQTTTNFSINAVYSPMKWSKINKKSNHLFDKMKKKFPVCLVSSLGENNFSFSRNNFFSDTVIGRAIFTCKEDDPSRLASPHHLSSHRNIIAGSFLFIKRNAEKCKICTIKMKLSYKL